MRILFYCLFLVLLKQSSCVWKNKLSSIVKKTPKEPSKLYSYVLSLKKLGEKFPNDVCEMINFDSLVKKFSISDFYFNYLTNKIMDCKVSIPKEVKYVEGITNVYKEGGAKDFSYVSVLLPLLKDDEGISNLLTDEKTLHSKVSKLAKQLKTLKDLSLELRGYIYESVKTLSRSCNKKDKGVMKDFVFIVDDAQRTLKEVRSTSGGILELSLFLKGVMRVSTLVQRKKLDANDVERVVNILQNRDSEVKNLQQLFSVVDSLSLAMKEDIVSVSELSFKKDSVVFTVKTLLGETIENTFFTIDITSKNDIIVEGEQVECISSKCTLNINELDEEESDALKEVGVFVFDLTEQNGYKTKRVLSNLALLEVKNFKFLNWRKEVSPRSTIGDELGFNLEKPLPEKIKITSDNSQLGVEMSIYKTFGVSKSPFNPAQVYICFTGDSQEVIYPISKKESNGNYKTLFNIEKSKKFKNFNGVYSVDLIIGDTALEKQKMYSLGKIEVSFDEEKQYEMSDEEEKYVLADKIEHKFQKKEVRASKFLSNLFSGLVFIPIMVFIFGITFFLGKIKLPRENFLFHVILQGTIICALVIIGLFWVKITVFKVFKYFLILLIIGMYFGTKALRSLNKSRN